MSGIRLRDEWAGDEWRGGSGDQESVQSKKERCLQAQNQQSGEVAGTSSLPPKTTSETCLLTMEVFKEKQGSDLSPSLELGDQSCHRPSLQAGQLLVMF